MPRTREDLTGQRFNGLVAIAPADNYKWIFRCDCGNEKALSASAVKRGNTTSCGHRRGVPPANAMGPFITRSQALSQGLARYYVGPCRKGHATGRLTSNMYCVECAADNAAKPENAARKVEYSKEYVRRPERKEKAAAYRQTEASRTYQREYRKANADRLGEYSAARYQSIKNEVNAATRERYNTDVQFQLMTLLRGRFKKVIRGERKTENCRRLVGCSLDELRQHIESQFLPGMTWENRGLYGWHIDHIRPCSSFDLLDPAQQEECFHYTNLQPLWAKDNLSKSAKWEAT